MLSMLEKNAYKRGVFCKGDSMRKKGCILWRGGGGGGWVKKGESQRMSSHDPPFPATLLENLTSA